MGDGNRCRHYFERECSMQRRRQKVWRKLEPPVLMTPPAPHPCDTAVAWPSGPNMSARHA